MVLKELIFSTLYFHRVWWSWNNWFWQFLILEGVVVLKELISNSFYLGWCGGPERILFNSFYFWRMWWSWKKFILNSCYFRRVWWSWKNWFLTFSTFGGCGSLERTDWSFVEKTSVKQDPKPQVCSNFQMFFLHLHQMDPTVEASRDQEWYYVRSAWHFGSGWPSVRWTPR